jgi:hypothetical protein
MFEIQIKVKTEIQTEIVRNMSLRWVMLFILKIVYCNVIFKKS